MSGSVGRQYLIQTWNGASEYSGELIGQRNKASTRMYLDNGKANIAAFREEEPKKGRQKKERTLEEKLYPQQATFARWEALEQETEQAFENGSIQWDEFQEKIAYILQKKDRAWYLLCKAKGWTDELEEYEIKKDIARLTKQIERQKEKNERIYQQQVLRQRTGRQRQPRGRQGSSWGWIIIAIGAFIIFF